MKIGTINFKGRVVLAPMVDVTDLAYRILCRRYGASLAYTPMSVINSIIHGNDSIKKSIRTCDEDKPAGVQIAGYDPLMFKKVLPYLNEFDLIDINFGCPVHKAENAGIGAVLLKKPEKIKEILTVLKKNTDQVITAKVRLGFDKIDIFKILEAVERGGADAITIHARTASSGRKDQAQWSFIQQVKEKSSIPVIGNGDVFTPNDVKDMLEIANFAMIARAAIGDPSFFKRVNQFLDDGVSEKQPGFEDKVKMFKEYYDTAKEYGLDDFAYMKTRLVYFMKGVVGAVQLRNKIIRSKNFDELFKLIGL